MNFCLVISFARLKLQLLDCYGFAQMFTKTVKFDPVEFYSIYMYM